jgi:hypothetical protein
VGVAGVQFFLDGAALGAEVTAAPYSVSWNTTSLANGSHTLTARARDAAGNATTSAAVAVTVANTISLSEPFPNNLTPPALPAPTGPVINVSTASQLQAAVANLHSGDTIVVAAGTYNLTDTLWVPQGTANVTIRGATGRADDVVINGAGMSGSILFGVWVGNTQNITVADLSLRNFADHGVELNAGAQAPLLHNLHLVDMGQQFIKSNPDNNGGGVNNGVVEYCTIEYTTVAPSYYTNGVDIHTGSGWDIRNNVFRNIRAQGALAGPAVLIWNGSSNITTEANTFINCQREIAYGLDSTRPDDNTGGIIRNNFISRAAGTAGDVAIGVWNSANTQVLNNTVKINGDYPNAVEYRFTATTGVNIQNNLTDAAIVSRDGATGTVTNNITNAQNSWFVNAAAGDLHLVSSATAAINQGTVVGVTSDYDGQSRPSGAAPDIGADEFSNGPADTQAPTVSLTAPASGASVNGTVTVTASAADNVGVAGVQFFLDGIALGAEDTTAPFTYSWNTAGVANGSHTLTARARDAAGNVTTSAAVTVTVANADTQAPTVSLTAPASGA